MVIAIELRRGVSPEEFLCVIRALGREEAVPAETPRATHAEAGEREVKIRLRAVRPVFETAQPRSLGLDFSLPRVAKVDLRPRLLSPLFEAPRQISLRFDYGIPAVKSLFTLKTLKPIAVSFVEAPELRLDLSFEPPRIAPPQLKLKGIAPSFEGPRGISMSIDFSAPSVVAVAAQPGLPDAPEAEVSLEELEEVYSEPLLKLGGVISERPVIVIAKPGEFGYIEFLKRMLREVYRVRAGGLPEAKHVSSIRDLKLLLPVDVGAGKRVFVLDLASMAPEELRELERLKGRLRDRLRELFSQEFGFFVIYGDVKDLGIWKRALGEAVSGYASVVPSPVEVSIRPERLPLYVLLASLMWGRVSDPVPDYERLGFRDLDELVVWLEDEYWRRLRDVSFEVLYKTRPSAGERESELHYLVKAFVARYLAERAGLDCVETEREEGGAVFDVVVTCGGLQGLAVEVETLYGTGTVVHKLAEAARKAGGRRLWIVVPNPQAVIYLPLLLRVGRELRRHRDVELYTLDVSRRALVPLAGVARELAGRWRELARERPAEGRALGRGAAEEARQERLRAVSQR